MSKHRFAKNSVKGGDLSVAEADKTGKTTTLEHGKYVHEYGLVAAVEKYGDVTRKKLELAGYNYENRYRGKEAEKTGKTKILEHGKYVHKHGLWAAMEEYPNVKKEKLRAAGLSYAKTYTGGEGGKTGKARVLEHGKYVHEYGLIAAVKKYFNVQKEKLRLAGDNYKKSHTGVEVGKTGKTTALEHGKYVYRYGLVAAIAKYPNVRVFKLRMAKNNYVKNYTGVETGKIGKTTALEHGKYVYEFGLEAAIAKYPNVRELKLRKAGTSYAKNFTGAEGDKTGKARALEHGKYVYEFGLEAAIAKYPNVRELKLRKAENNYVRNYMGEQAGKTWKATALEHGKYVYEHGLQAAVSKYPNVKEVRLRAVGGYYAKNYTGAQAGKTDKARALEHGKYVYEHGLRAAVSKYPNVKEVKLRAAGGYYAKNHTAGEFRR